MSDLTQDKEKEIAIKFSSFPSSELKEKFVIDLPRNINITKVQDNLSTLSDKIEFARFFLGRDRFFSGLTREFRRKKNEIAKHIGKTEGNYKEAKYYLNPFRRTNENLLRYEALEQLSSKNDKYKNFYNDIFEAEKIAKEIRENSFNKEALKTILSKNAESIKNNRIILENLKDLFDNDSSLKGMQSNLNNFLVNHVEDEKPIKEVISDAEERILTGDITNVYNEIEKTEKIISLNISQNLIDAYNSIQVMASKNNFVSFIKESESQNIPEDQLNSFIDKTNEYRNIVLPKKWNEMKYKLKYTTKIEHFKAWLYGLKQGRYKGIVANVKEYVVRELIKKIITAVVKLVNQADIQSIALYNLLDGKRSHIEKLKAGYKNFLKFIDDKKFNNIKVLDVLYSFMRYLFFLYNDLLQEKEITDDLFNSLKQAGSFDNKIKLIENRKNGIIKQIKEEELKQHITVFFDKLQKIYELLNNKKTEQVEFEDYKNDRTDEASSIINSLVHEVESTGKIERIQERIEALPENESVDVLNTLNFDKRFEEYYPDIENALLQKDWGRVFGIIGLKIKDIEKKHGMVASEEYLDDLVQRVDNEIGKNSFVAKKLLYMKNNLRKIHSEGAKKLNYLNYRLSHAKNSAEKILELQRISKDPRYKGVFGVIQNMERILIRDHFDDIYKKVKTLNIDAQTALFKGIAEDLNDLLEYEPEIVKKVNNYIDTISYKLDNYKDNVPQIDEKLVDSLEEFEKGELPLLDITEMIDLEMPLIDEYSIDNVQEKIETVKHEVNKGNLTRDDLEMILTDINNDMSLFRIEGTDESMEILNNAGKLTEGIDSSINRLDELEELKESKNVRDAVDKILMHEAEGSESDTDTINMLNNVFEGMSYGLNDKAKGFGIAQRRTKNKDTGSKMKDIVEVIRRIEREVEPLVTLENKISKIVEWIDNDYNDKDYIKEFLKQQIKELSLKKGLEGGLLRKLLDGLNKVDDKIKYLKEAMDNPDYAHMLPVIKNLLNNIKEEMGIKAEDITGEWIDETLDNKNDDEQLEWLKVRKYWDKYEKHYDNINDKIEKLENKLKSTPHEDVKYFDNITDLTDAVLDLNGQANRQNFIKSQDEIDENENNLLKSQRKMLFYMMSAENDEPDSFLKALCNRVTLGVSDKQKYLQMLKKSANPDGRNVQGLLNIDDEKLGYYATYVLYSDKPLGVRIKYLERFKQSSEPKVENYKNIFGITDKTVSDVINNLISGRGSAETSRQSTDTFTDVSGVPDSDKANTDLTVDNQNITSTNDNNPLENNNYIDDNQSIKDEERKTLVKEQSDDYDEYQEESIEENAKEEEITDYNQNGISNLGENKRKTSDGKKEEALEYAEDIESDGNYNDSIADNNVDNNDGEDFHEELNNNEEMIENNEEENEVSDDSESEIDYQDDSLNDIVNENEQEEKDKKIQVVQESIKKQKMKEDFKKNEEFIKKREELRKKQEEVTDFQEQKNNEVSGHQDEIVEEDGTGAEQVETGNTADINETSGTDNTFDNEGFDDSLVNVDKGQISSKTTEEIINEQKIRSSAKRNEKVANRLEEKAKQRAREIVEKIREKAHEIKEQEDKKTEDKFSALLSYLTTCYPEAVAKIIEEEILPVFRQEGLNLNVHNMLQTVNDSIFKPAMRGNDVSDNVKFLSKTLTPENSANIKAIVKKINDIWQAESEAVENQENQVASTIENINKGLGIESVLVYLDKIFPQDIIPELNNNFIKNLKNDKVKSQADALNNFLRQVYESGDVNENQKKKIEKSFALDGKYLDTFDNLLDKVSDLKKVEARSKRPVSVKSQILDKYKTKNKRQEQEIFKKDNVVSMSLDVEEALEAVGEFVKPHIFILDVARSNEKLNEEDFDLEKRKGIVEKLYKKGKIFSYDNGKSFIGKGHIKDIVVNNSIVSSDRESFVTELDKFIKNFKTNDEVYDFLGVENESELRKLNFILDKYSLNRSGGSMSKTGFGGGSGGKSGKKINAPVGNARKDTDQSINSNFSGQKNISQKGRGYAEQIKNQQQKKLREQQKKQENLKEIMKKQKEFVTKHERQVLTMAAKEIDKHLEKLIKSATSRFDLETLQRNFFGSKEFHRRNMLNLCYDIKQIADIIDNDKNLFDKLTFNKKKIDKLINSKMKKLK